ncbi:alpha-mannosidase [Streptomyces sp. SID8379]|uniref:glycoside hydrolase family 38 N-terminal domain-containing protein n=1 Tax=unclassified Streptomyces TaxID=2593676 RepID=UPI000368B097|nr:NEW3 domain-containing protein [Streptomyces sp. HmicA12]MYW63112.1 alpha-mannosidase [Streptomyces sp. SID8379]
MRILSVRPTDLFTGPADDPLQVVRVELSEPGRVVIEGPGLHGEGADGEIGVRCAAPPGTVVPLTVTAGGATAHAELTVAEPGWTVWMVPHFHYDPVWWNTQAAYTTTWDTAGETAQRFRIDWQYTGFELMRLHLETARRDPDYKFVLAEVDYLKPYWDAHPQDRAHLRRLLAEGRVELMGGTYNEPNTNLTSAESTVRNLVYGIGFQRGIMGGDPQTAWQLDVFGHDPQFPGLAADAGLTSSSWARGPYHQWGPMLTDRDREKDGWGDPSTMQFPAEFEWLSPSGRGVLTHYMPAHYSAGWWMDSATSLADAEDAVLDLYRLMKKVAATRNLLLPVGTDYTPPNRWVTEIHRDFAARYTWPRLKCALPAEFFAAVRAELPEPSPQTRDMNPVYTGKDVSFIDTKQAQRAAETLLTEAETFATLASVETGADHPHARIDKAWRQLAYGAHHDAITGSESDQVYLDLLTGWREAYDTGREVLDVALSRLGSADGDAVTVFNPSAWPRTDLVRVHLTPPEPGFQGWEFEDGTPLVLEHERHHADGTLAEADVVFLAADVPSLGYRVFRPRPSRTASRWAPADDATRIANATHTLEIDPRRGGCVSRLTVEGRELLQAGRVGNELLVYDEYSAHPRYHEGPWHLVPSGPVTGSASSPATSVRTERCAAGERITVTGTVGPVTYTQTLTLWHGLDRLDGVTHIDTFDGADRLLRLRWPVRVPGALPVSEVADAVVGRGFGLIDVDSAEHPWTLDNPANNWFALSSTARVRLPDGDRAIGIAEIVTADGAGTRELAVALVRSGVTSTCSAAPGARYGDLAVDSNLPDVRIAIGGPDENPFTAQVLTGAYAETFEAQLAATGRARVWIPAESPLEKVWVPGADLRSARALPVLVVAGEGAVEELVADLDDSTIEVADSGPLTEPPLDDYTVALVNRGVPGFAVDSTGALHLSLMRSCTGWPSGIWIDPPHRTHPDGSAFQQQHWTHSFDYSLVAGPGDWRAQRLVPRAHDVNHPLRPVVRGERADQPDTRSYLAVEPAGQVVVTALKPTGNPLAEGQVARPVDGLTLRLHEAEGRPTRARIVTDLPLTAAHRADLLERAHQPLDALALDLGGMDIATVTAQLARPRGGVAPGTEPHQPVFTRYWLHNTGPAPTGNLPVAVHLDPPVLHGAAETTVTVASSLAAHPAAGEVHLILPEGWSADTTVIPYAIEPDGHLAHRTRVAPPDDAEPGTYWLRARTTHDGQTYEDVTRAVIGAESVTEPTAKLLTPVVRLAAGERGTIEVRLASDVLTPVTVQAQLISPWQTFGLFPQWNTGAEVPARGAHTLRFPVSVPFGARPGRWWAVVKLAAAGRLHYTEAVEVEVIA